MSPEVRECCKDAQEPENINRNRCQSIVPSKCLYIQQKVTHDCKCNRNKKREGIGVVCNNLRIIYFFFLVLVDNLSRPYLVTYIPGATDYINAVFVDVSILK